MGEKFSGYSEEDMDKRAEDDLKRQLEEQKWISDFIFEDWYQKNNPKPIRVYIEEPDKKKGEKNGN